MTDGHKKDVGLFLVHAREKARQLDAQITEFSKRVRAMGSRSTALGQASSLAERRADDVALVHELELRDTELSVAEEELRQQNEELIAARSLLEQERAKYLDLFEHAPDAYVVTDTRGVIDDANQAAADLFGVKPGGLGGRLLISFVARQDTRSFRDQLGTLAPDESRTFEARMRPRGGDVFRVALSVRPIRGLRGRPVGLRWTLRPSDPVAAEASRAASWVDLLGELAQVMIHELRQPLTSIVGWSRMLRAGIVPVGEQQDALGNIEDGAASQAAILTELADVLACWKGGGAGEALDLVQLVRDAIEPCHDVAAATGVEVALAVPPAPCLLSADAGASMRRALGILFRRAVRSAPPASHVQIAVRSEDGQGVVELQAVAPLQLGRIGQAAVEGLLVAAGARLALRDPAADGVAGLVRVPLDTAAGAALPVTD